MRKILVILGPTATGKTDLAINLAKEFDGELVSCDSRQVYIGLDIGTGKLPSKNSQVKIQRDNTFWIIDGVKVWLYDLLDPKEQYTVLDYIKDAEAVIEDILKRGKLPIIVGGTGLYLKALLEGLSNLAIPVNEKLREELKGLSTTQLQSRLKAIDLKRWDSLNNSDRQNPRRLLRSIELYMNPYINENNKLKTNKNWQVLKLGLTAPKEILRENIKSRLLTRLDSGLLEEGEKLYQGGLSLKRMRELGLEYKYLAEWLEEKITREDLEKILNIKIGQYAKRQLTWFKKEKNIDRFDITQKDMTQKVASRVNAWYNSRV